jgi:hypothetical protein
MRDDSGNSEAIRHASSGAPLADRTLWTMLPPNAMGKVANDLLEQHDLEEWRACIEAGLERV